MHKVKIIVLRTAGTNNDLETRYGFILAGADEVDLVHINQLFRKEVKLNKYDILAIPGGFSYGDYISAGKIFANKLKFNLREEIEKFIKSGKLIIGICNGFQVLVKAGFLPGINGFKQTTSLSYNDSGKFECRWVYLKVNEKLKMKNGKTEMKSIWVKNLPKIIQLPVAHAEGKFIANEKTINELEKNSQVVFEYCDESGNRAGYPYNPNGSINNIAGICNPEGNVFGLMPHPERFVNKFQFPIWTGDAFLCNENQSVNVQPYGLTILQNAVEYVKKN